jgi:hypothetical protein
MPLAKDGPSVDRAAFGFRFACHDEVSMTLRGPHTGGLEFFANSMLSGQAFSLTQASMPYDRRRLAVLLEEQ